MSKYAVGSLLGLRKRDKERKAGMPKRKGPQIGGFPFYQIVLHC